MRFLLAQVVIMDPCHGLTKDDWMYWVLGCFMSFSLVKLALSSTVVAIVAAVLTKRRAAR